MAPQAWMVRCPAHADGRASLSVTPGRQAVLFHCFAGCKQDAILAALRDLRLNPSVRGANVEPEKPPRDLMPLVASIWGMARATPGTPGQLYLERRGIGGVPSARFTPSALTYEGGRKLRLPALLLPMYEGPAARFAADLSRPGWTESAMPRWSETDAGRHAWQRDPTRHTARRDHESGRRL
jgi:hypothetical protein